MCCLYKGSNTYFTSFVVRRQSLVISRQVLSRHRELDGYDGKPRLERRWSYWREWEIRLPWITFFSVILARAERHQSWRWRMTMFPTSLSIVSLVLVIFSSYAAIVILVKLAWVLAQAHSGEKMQGWRSRSQWKRTSSKNMKNKNSNSSGLESGSVQERLYAKVLLLGPPSMIAPFDHYGLSGATFELLCLVWSSLIWCFRWNRTSWKSSKKTKPRSLEFVHVNKRLLPDNRIRKYILGNAQYRSRI